MPVLSLSEHFRQIAHRYPRVRSLDVHAVRRVAKMLARVQVCARGLRLLDVGTGTGRYLEAVCAELRQQGVPLARPIGTDSSASMLGGFSRVLARSGECPAAVAALGEALPLTDASFDAVLSFNAVHHFALEPFLAEATRLLEPPGLLVLYTRTPEQNRATIWGRHFPGFAARERRLYTRNELRTTLQRSRAFTAIQLRVTAWWQFTTLPTLLRQARARHYSTFRFYEPEEFNQALAAFREQVRRSYHRSWAIPTRNDHLIVFARRRA